MPTIPDQDKVVSVFELHFAKPYLSPTAIAKRLGFNHREVIRWIRNPGKYYPWVDEVAVKRALGGDRAVYRNLTLWEQQEFWKQNAKITADTELMLRETGEGAVWYNPRTDFVSDCLGLERNTVIDYNRKWASG